MTAAPIPPTIGRADAYARPALALLAVVVTLAVDDAVGALVDWPVAAVVVAVAVVSVTGVVAAASCEVYNEPTEAIKPEAVEQSASYSDRLAI
jgi:hypothetical protein